MQRALAVAGEDDRPVLRLRGKKGLECLLDIAIGGVERLARGDPVGIEEGAERRLAIARRPDLARVGKVARDAAHEQGGARIGGGVVARGVSSLLVALSV